jgi:hypothetical protein
MITTVLRGILIMLLSLAGSVSLLFFAETTAERWVAAGLVLVVFCLSVFYTITNISIILEDRPRQIE